MSKIISMHRDSDGNLYARHTGDVTTLPSSNDGASVAHSSRKDNAKTKRGVTRHQPLGAAEGKDHLVGSAANNNTPIVKEVVLKAQTPGQRPYIRDLQDMEKDIVVATAPAGAGKTYLAVLEGIAGLRAGRYKKVIVTRPMVASGGEELGILPGGIIEKVGPWCIPVLDIFKEFYSTHQVEQLLRSEVLELAPLAIMRGRTLKNAFVIGDEMQNTTVGQMKMFMTRLGEGSRMVITGDTEQFDEEQLRKATGIDRDEELVSGLRDLLTKLRNDGVPETFGLHQMSLRDVVRHRAVGTVLRLYA
jgi:phosphate starvation-inducible PhoH-like protein